MEVQHTIAEFKTTNSHHTCTTLHSLLIQMQNISLRGLGMHRKQNFEIAFAFKSDNSLDLLFTFSPPIFFAFLASFFSRLQFRGKVFKKALRILRLDKRKGTCRWVQWNKIFMEIFRSMLHFSPFSPVSLTELCSFWYGLKDLFTLHKLADKVFLDH